MVWKLQRWLLIIMFDDLVEEGTFIAARLFETFLQTHPVLQDNPAYSISWAISMNRRF